MENNVFKKALVTGGAGFIGSHLCRSLLDKGLEVVVIDNLTVGKKENVDSRAQLVIGDILDEKLIDSIIRDGVDIVFHEAALVTIRESFANFYNDAMTNIMGTLNIIRSSLKYDVEKIIFASSMGVYSDSSDHILVAENHTKQPIAPYGLSKLTSEEYLKHMTEDSQIDVICLRYFNTYGENQTLSPYVGVITIFVNRLLNGEQPLIFGNGQQTRDFIYVQDIVQANIKAMSSDMKFGIFIVGTGVGTTVNEIAELLCKKMNQAMKPVHKAPVLGELQHSVADISLIKKQLGYEPEFMLEDKIDSVINQYR